MPEHGEYSDALPAYALGALSDDEVTRLKHHLDECPECRAGLEWLRAGVEVLPASVPQIEAPPELKRRLMAVVEAEAELLRAGGASADRPEAARRRWWSSPSAARLAVGAAALCVAAIAVVLAVSAGGTGTRTVSAQTTLAGARASLQVRGTRAELVVTGLPALAADHVEEIWVKRGSAPAAPAGTFVLGSGSVAVARPVRPGDLVLVTVEPRDGTAAPTTAPVIVARI